VRDLQEKQNKKARSTPVDSLLSARIVTFLEENEGLSKKEIGDAMGLCRSYISLVKNRQRSLTLDRLKRLEEYLRRPLPLLLIQAMETEAVPHELKSQYALLRRILRKGVEERELSWKV
jgi:transcriptional regulator with XRE-family HTH domain